ncbi:hypothetical protein JL721_12619 [Aureococcus anophagefferens]|nr:hypothetical protein JL721_12619 [Aureococcus anophagefferens]
MVENGMNGHKKSSPTREVTVVVASVSGLKTALAGSDRRVFVRVRSAAESKWQRTACAPRSAAAWDEVFAVNHVHRGQLFVEVVEEGRKKASFSAVAPLEAQGRFQLPLAPGVALTCTALERKRADAVRELEETYAGVVRDRDEAYGKQVVLLRERRCEGHAAELAELRDGHDSALSAAAEMMELEKQRQCDAATRRQRDRSFTEEKEALEAALRDGHGRDREALERQHGEHLEKLRSRTPSSRAAATLSGATLTASRRSSHKAAFEKQVANHKQLMDDHTATHETSRVRDSVRDDSYGKQLGQMRESHAVAVEAMRRGHDQRAHAEKDRAHDERLAAALGSMRDDHDAALGSMRDDHDAASAEARTPRAVAGRWLHRLLSEGWNKWRTSVRVATVAEMRSSTREIAALRNAARAEDANAGRCAPAPSTPRRRQRAGFDDERSTLEEELVTTLVERHAKELEKRNAEHAILVANCERSARAELDCRRGCEEDLRIKHKEALADQAKKHAAALQERDDEYVAQLQALRETHAAAVSAMRENHSERELDARSSAYDRELASKDEQFRALEAELRADREHFASQLAELEARHTAEMEERMAELEESHFEAMNEAVRSVAADKDRERDISLSSRTQQHSKSLEDCEAALLERHETAVATAHAEHETAVATLTERHREELELAAERHDATMASVAFAALTLAAQRQGHETELATFMAKFSNDRARRVLGRWACRLLSDGFVTWCSSARAARVEEVQRHHAEELAAARTEAANARARRVLGRWTCRLLSDGFQTWCSSVRAAGAEAIRRHHAES